MIHKLFFEKAQTGNFYPVYYAEGERKTLPDIEPRDFSRPADKPYPTFHPVPALFIGEALKIARGSVRMKNRDISRQPIYSIQLPCEVRSLFLRAFMIFFAAKTDFLFRDREWPTMIIIIGFFLRESCIPRNSASTTKLEKKDKELGPNQDPILRLDKILENLYNQISPKPVKELWTLRLIFRELGIT